MSRNQALILLFILFGISIFATYVVCDVPVRKMVHQYNAEAQVYRDEAVKVKEAAEKQHKCMVNVIARIRLGEEASASECDPNAVAQEREIQLEIRRLKGGKV